MARRRRVPPARFPPVGYLDKRRFLSELRDPVVDPQWELKAGAGLPENLESKTGSPAGTA
jgi:hypothetical protein